MNYLFLNFDNIEFICVHDLCDKFIANKIFKNSEYLKYNTADCKYFSKFNRYIDEKYNCEYYLNRYPNGPGLGYFLKNKDIPHYYANANLLILPRDLYFNDDLILCANFYKTDKGDIWGNRHNYAYYYQKYFNNFRNNQISLFEIGIASGSSILCWNSWFKNIKITCCDINEKCKNLFINFKNIDVLINDINNLELCIEYDIIIDDGSHLANDIISSFLKFWKNVKRGGYYIIEDIDACKNINYVISMLNKNIINDEKIKENSWNKLHEFIMNLNNICDIDKYTIHDEKIIFIKKCV